MEALIRGVIFDMDGVITDTERLFLSSWGQIMAERGLPRHEDVVAHCIGLNHAATKAYVTQRMGADFDYDRTMEEVNRRSRRYMDDHGVPVKPGLYGLLDYLDAHRLPYAVATSTAQVRARPRLEEIGVLPRLKALVTGDMVQHGKPDPDIFLLAASRLHLPPEDCVVLEDSPHGILAASRAGCHPVMIPDLKEPDPEPQQLLLGTVKTLADVIPLLDQLT